MQSGELLDILTNPERKEYKKYRATIKHADFVTISIGSNDLLHLIQLDLNMEEMIKRDAHKFDEACVQFAKTFPKIIREIRAVNPDVKYMRTIFIILLRGLMRFHRCIRLRMLILTG